MSEELKALDLFKGGEKGVHQRMAQIIRKGLINKIREIKHRLACHPSDVEVMKAIARKLYLDYELLARIYHKNPRNGDISYELFDRLEFPFDLSIFDAFGKPSALNKSKVREDWLEECRRHPMLGIAHNVCVQNRGFDQIKVLYADAQRKELNLYVALRAITELRQAKH